MQKMTFGWFYTSYLYQLPIIIDKPYECSETKDEAVQPVAIAAKEKENENEKENEKEKKKRIKKELNTRKNGSEERRFFGGQAACPTRFSHSL